MGLSASWMVVTVSDMTQAWLLYGLAEGNGWQGSLDP